MKVLKCPICGNVRETVRRHKTCSRACGQRLLKRERGADFHRLAGVRAGRASAVRTREKSETLWRERYPDVPTTAARAIYNQGFNSGHATGKRHGFRNGYNAARSGLQLARTV